MRKTIIFSIIVLFGLNACENQFTQIVDLEIPPHDPKIVSYCIVDVSSDTVRVELSKSQQILIDEDPVIKEAEIRLLKNESLITDAFDLEKKFIDFDYSSPSMDSIFAYQFRAIPGEDFEIGASYSLEVDTEGLSPVVAHADVPEPVEITSIEFNKDGIIDPEGYTSDELVVKFSDPEDQPNYYLIAAQVEEWYDGMSYLNDVYLGGIDPRINESSYSSNIIKDVRTYVYFTDKEGINGMNNSLSFACGIYLGNDSEEVNLKVRLYSLSKPLYDFCHAYNQYENSEGLFFAEPVTIPSNFENGYGVFGIYTYTEEQLSL